MSSNYDFMLEQARQKPDSTAAIGLRAIQDEQDKLAHQRKQAVKGFFGRLFSKKA